MPLQWTITENGISFDLRHSQGMSSGLFLDQRENREEVRETTHGKKVANFFSYTCGFSVAAAMGGAAEVVSVDTSKQSLDWGKDNFKLNGLDPEKYEFFTADTLFFLNSCMKRGRKFDMILLDPPTFSRAKGEIFRLAEKLAPMIETSLKCLEKEGRILFTYNDEELSPSHVAKIIEEVALKLGFTFVRLEKVKPPLDFEFPLERDTVLRGFWISI